MYTLLTCLVASLAAAALADSTYHVTGVLERVQSNDNNTSCTFTINGKNSPSDVRNKQICDFLLKAHEHNTPVAVAVTPGADGAAYAVDCHNTNAGWAGAKLESAPFKYQLVGMVEDVYITDASCYVAVDTGYDVRNNKHFHFTADRFVCDQALAAFYQRQRVTMLATVDTTPKYSNNIDRFITTPCP